MTSMGNRMKRQQRCCIACAVTVFLFLAAGAVQAATPFRLGLNADNWSGQSDSAQFRQSVKELGVEFIVWHVHPDELDSGLVQKAVDFCRRDGLGYLFNTEVVNYLPRDKRFVPGDRTYRWDIKADVLDKLKDDPLFLGVVYDEAILMQNLAGTRVGNRTIEPYFVDTRKMTPEKAFEAVAGKIDELSAYYQRYNGMMVMETLFPDASFVASRGGAVLAVKLLKENYLDLAAMMAGGAARQYLSENGKKGRGLELWACVDLWYLDMFPNAEMHGTIGKDGGHTSQELRQALEYAYNTGFDAAYIEMNKGVMDTEWKLTEHGRTVVEFDRWRKEQPERDADWRTPPAAAFTVRRFPSGNPGGKLPDFLNLSSYGCGTYRFLECFPAIDKGYCGMDNAWFRWFFEHAENAGKGAVESFAGTTFNSEAHRARSVAEVIGRPYQPMAGLPDIDFVDHTASSLPSGRGDQIDFYSQGK